eukprot:357554-Chlamydomonas_euryale.AAC.10
MEGVWAFCRRKGSVERRVQSKSPSRTGWIRLCACKRRLETLIPCTLGFGKRKSCTLRCECAEVDCPCLHQHKRTSLPAPRRHHLNHTTPTAPGWHQLNHTTPTAPRRHHLNRTTPTAPRRHHLNRTTPTAPRRHHLNHTTPTAPRRHHLNRTTPTAPGRHHLNRSAAHNRRPDAPHGRREVGRGDGADARLTRRHCASAGDSRPLTARQQWRGSRHQRVRCRLSRQGRQVGTAVPVACSSQPHQADVVRKCETASVEPVGHTHKRSSSVQDQNVSTSARHINITLAWHVRGLQTGPLTPHSEAQALHASTPPACPRSL